MPGNYHIVWPHAQYVTRRVPYHETGPGHRNKTHTEETITSICGKTLVRYRDQSCGLSIANPEWDYDWCHDCVKAILWTEDARKAWTEKGIETLDPESWEKWINSPEGEYANLKKFG